MWTKALTRTDPPNSPVPERKLGRHVGSTRGHRRSQTLDGRYQLLGLRRVIMRRQDLHVTTVRFGPEDEMFSPLLNLMIAHNASAA